MLFLITCTDYNKWMLDERGCITGYETYTVQIEADNEEEAELYALLTAQYPAV